jgi:hypothetical protein
MQKRGEGETILGFPLCVPWGGMVIAGYPDIVPRRGRSVQRIRALNALTGWYRLWGMEPTEPKEPFSRCRVCREALIRGGLRLFGLCLACVRDRSKLPQKPQNREKGWK